MIKKITTALMFLVIGLNAQAQNGLEQILVEKYYISDANDTLANLDGGVLPVGSVTYRIYVDMLQGYKFQAAYGVPGHDLKIQTSTLFFNNEDRGSTTPAFSKTLAAKNTVMLDSWLSVGAACNGQFGILKSLDNGVANIVNNYSPQVLQNNDPLAGIPLTTQDGLIAGTPEPVTLVGINTEIGVFDNQNDGTNGPLFYTNNGSWASLNGSVGPDTVDNKVLIAQITTDGNFSFELNIQIGTPAGGVENYVAKNPVGNEISIPSLIYPQTVGVSDNAHTPTVRLYPNPANDVLYLDLGNSATSAGSMVELFNLSGQLMMSEKIYSQGSRLVGPIDIQKLSAGIYMLRLSSDAGVVTQKFVKQ